MSVDGDVELLIRKVVRQEKEIEDIKKGYRSIKLALDYLEPLADEFYSRRDEEAGKSYA